MARELKFRAYHKKEQRFYYFDLETCTQTICVCYYHPVTGEKDCELDDYNLYSEKQLYTGLKDKNGKEIYEGDIVEAPDIFSDKKSVAYSIKWNDSYARFVTWHENIGCCRFLYAFSGNLMPVGMDKEEGELDTRSIEVIGNIYENPELLEKAK